MSDLRLQVPYVKNLTYEQYNAALLERDAEIERLRRFLEIAVDAYEDEHGQPNRDSHWAARARVALGHQQGAGEQK